MENLIVGIDEAGRGPWAGPLTAAAVLLPVECVMNGVKDSKQLTIDGRSRLAAVIARTAQAVGLGWASPSEIDQLGLRIATTLAMGRAYAQLGELRARIIIDGSINYLPDIPLTETLVRADQTIPAVSAASIIAKHYRDQYMKHLAHLYPEYGFERHVGYGTSAHAQALAQYGACLLHRHSFAPVRRRVAAIG